MPIILDFERMQNVAGGEQMSLPEPALQQMRAKMRPYAQRFVAGLPALSSDEFDAALAARVHAVQSDLALRHPAEDRLASAVDDAYIAAFIDLARELWARIPRDVVGTA